MHDRQQRYYQQEPDPFDLFEMFFNGGGTQFQFNNGNIYRRQRQRGQREEVQGYKVLIYQLLPFILFMLIYILPVIFQSSPVWQFDRNNEFYIKKTTQNGAVFFTNDKFSSYYSLDTMSPEEKKSLFTDIDYQYLHYLQSKCSKVMKIKQELQYKIYY